MRFRYSLRLVEPALSDNPTALRDEKTTIVFAASQFNVPGASPHENQDQLSPPLPRFLRSFCKAPASRSPIQGFEFIPIRSGTVVRADKKGDVFIIDIELGPYCYFGPTGNQIRQKQWHSAIKGRTLLHPRPKGSVPEGYFVHRADSLNEKDQSDSGSKSDCERAAKGGWCGQEPNEYERWQSVTEQINQTELEECLTYRVVGFYRFGRHGREVLVKPTTRGPDCFYRFKMGGTVVMKLFFYRSEPLVSPYTLRVRTDQRGITSVSDDSLVIASRYDEARFLLSCARVTEPVYAPLKIACEANHVGTDRPRTGPAPEFVTTIRPSTSFLGGIVIIFALGLVLLQFNTQDFTGFLHQLLNVADGWWIAYLARAIPKPLGTLLVMVAAWLFMRKFPLK